MPRAKPAAPALTVRDWEHCDQVLGQLCADTAQLQAIEAELNADLTRVRERYEADCSVLRGLIDQRRSAVEAFAVARRADLAPARSRELLHGRVGFKLSPPAVALLNRRWTFASAVEMIREVGPRLARWLRLKYELNKPAVMADHESGSASDADLAAVGLRVSQAEEFILDLKLETVQEAAR